MTSFADAEFKPACRAGLTRLARWAYLGRLDNWSACCLAGSVRRLAPVLADATDEQVLTAFGELCVDVLTVESLRGGLLPGCAMAGDLEIEAAQMRLDCTLAALVPGESL